MKFPAVGFFFHLHFFHLRTAGATVAPVDQVTHAIAFPFRHYGDRAVGIICHPTAQAQLPRLFAGVMAKENALYGAENGEVYPYHNSDGLRI